MARIEKTSTVPSFKISRKNKASSNIKIDSSMPIRDIKKLNNAKLANSIPAVEPEIDEVKNAQENLKFENKAIRTIKNLKNEKSNKKSLHLDLSSVKPQEDLGMNVTKEIKYVKDTSVNQNSPFFSEPSIFEKFVIDVTDTEDNDVPFDSENIEKGPVEAENVDEKRDENEDTTPVSILKSQEEIQASNSNIIEEMLESIITESESNTFIKNLDEEINEEINEEITNESTNQEVVDSISDGNFFNSSIQNIDPDQEVNASNVFKNFNFDGSEVTTNETSKVTLDSLQVPQNIITANPINEINIPVNEISTNQNLQTIKENAGINNIDMPSVSTDVVNALTSNSVDTIQDIMPNIITPSNTADELNMDDEKINIEDISIEDLKLDDIDLDDINLEDLDITNKDLESIEEKDNEIESSENNEIIESELELLKNLSDDEIDALLDNQINDNNEENDIIVEDDNIDYSNIPLENDNQLEDDFSIEDYFGLNEIATEDIQDDNIIEDNLVSDEELLDSTSDEEPIEENSQIEESIPTNDEIKDFSTQIDSNSEITNLTDLIRNFTQTISTLNERISDLESGKLFNNQSTISSSTNIEDEILEDEELLDKEFSQIEENDEEDINIEDINLEDLEISIDDLDDIDIEDIDIQDNDFNENDEVIEINENEENNTSVKKQEQDIIEDESLIDNNQLLDEDILSDEDLENSLIEEMLSQNLSESEVLDSITDTTNESSTENDNNQIEEKTEATSDLYKILETLSKTIDELENEQEEVKPQIKTYNNNLPVELQSDQDTFEDGKEINILINKDDIFSISIINETYEIVADFDGISVLSENIHISTPKNNFYIKIGDNYIEIHNKKDQYLVQTNFEDIEFANSINNVTFGKKNNLIELNIKEAFKISSVNNKLELSMLNSPIADVVSMAKPEEKDENSSICDNKTLLISEETQKVYLPYTIKEVMKKLNDSDEYQSLEEVISKEYTLPLSTFKIPALSRFREAYKLMREKEKSSRYAAMDLGVELMFNSNLNPAIIRAAKDLKELNIYLDCLYENEVEKFDCFKIVYKVLPKIQ